MKKKSLIIAALSIALLAVLAAAFFFPKWKKPYKDLDAAQIASARVLLTPPGETVEIEDIQELLDILRDVVIYREDDSYTDYAGQGVVFTLIMTDGTRTEIMAYNPFLVIDGIGYRTEYEHCEALSRYANALLDSEPAG